MGKLERAVAQKTAVVETANGINEATMVFQDHGPVAPLVNARPEKPTSKSVNR